MSKSDKPAARQRVVLEKRGGYSGGKPASEVGPPPKIPSAAMQAQLAARTGAARTGTVRKARRPRPSAA